MTEEEFEKLRDWGDALTSDVRPEVRAAGRAILLLASEVERLQVELWHVRLGIERGAEHATDGWSRAEPRLEPALQGQIRSALARAGRVTKLFQTDRGG